MPLPALHLDKRVDSACVNSYLDGWGFYKAPKWTKRDARNLLQRRLLPRFERCWSREDDSLLQQAPQTAAAMLTARTKCFCAQPHGIAKQEYAGKRARLIWLDSYRWGRRGGRCRGAWFVVDSVTSGEVNRALKCFWKWFVSSFPCSTVWIILRFLARQHGTRTIF